MVADHRGAFGILLGVWVPLCSYLAWQTMGHEEAEGGGDFQLLRGVLCNSCHHGCGLDCAVSNPPLAGQALCLAIHQGHYLDLHAARHCHLPCREIRALSKVSLEPTSCLLTKPIHFRCEVFLLTYFLPLACSDIEAINYSNVFNLCMHVPLELPI